jgi:IPT/TIG domain-containing protein
VILTGTGFAEGATVTFDGTAATDVKVTSTRIDAVTPPHAAGKVDVEVRNPDCGTAKLPAGFEYV